MDKNIEQFEYSDRTVASANQLDGFESGTEQLQPPALQFKQEETESESAEPDMEEKIALHAAPEPPAENKILAPSIQLKQIVPAVLTPPPPIQLAKETKSLQEKEEKEQPKEQDGYSIANDGGDESAGDENNSGHSSAAQLKDEPQSFTGKGGASSGKLPEELQSNLESNLGTPLSNVNIHTDSSTATDIGALAYTQGNDVYFAPGQFNPDSSAGKELIGHELTHVKQQREGRVNATTSANNGMPVNDDKGLEKEADDVGKKAIQRKADPGEDFIGDKNILQTDQDSIQGKFEVIQKNEGDNEQEDETDDEENVQPLPDTAIVTRGSTTINFSETTYDITGTYREISNQLAQPGEDGSIGTTPGISYEPINENSANVVITVDMVKTMPNWTNLPNYRQQAENHADPEHRRYYSQAVSAWDDFYAHLNAHEDAHKAIDERHFRDLHTRLIGKNLTESDTEFDAVVQAANDANNQYHTDHGTHESLRYVQEPGEGRVQNNSEPAQPKMDEPSSIQSQVIQKYDDPRPWYQQILGIETEEQTRRRLLTESQERSDQATSELEERRNHPEQWPVAFTESGGNATIIEYDSNHQRRNDLTFVEGRDHYNVGDVILTHSFDATWLRRIFPDINRLIGDGQTSVWDVLGTYLDSNYGQRKIGWRINRIDLTDSETGDGFVDLQAVLFISSNEVVEISGRNGTQSHNRDSLSNRFQEHLTWERLETGIQLIGTVVEFSVSLLSGSIGMRAIGRQLGAAGLRMLPRVMRPIILRIFRGLASRVARMAFNIVSTYMRDRERQEEDNTIRSNAGRNTREIDDSGALERAIISAITTEITSAFGDFINERISSGLADALPSYMHASLGNRIKVFIAQQIASGLGRGLRLGEALANAHVRAGRGENYREVLQEELRSVLLPNFSEPEQTAGSLANSFASEMGSAAGTQASQGSTGSSGSSDSTSSNPIQGKFISKASTIQKKEETVNTTPNDIPSGIQIHKDSKKATDLGALAFTQGSDIHFAPGQFKPDTKSGQELIGHELKHLEQQAEGRVSPTIQKKGSAINDDPTLEKEADDFGKVYAEKLAKTPERPIQRKDQDQAFQLKAKNEGISLNMDSNIIQKSEEDSNNFEIQSPLGFYSDKISIIAFYADHISDSLKKIKQEADSLYKGEEIDIEASLLFYEALSKLDGLKKEFKDQEDRKIEKSDFEKYELAVDISNKIFNILQKKVFNKKKENLRADKNNVIRIKKSFKITDDIKENYRAAFEAGEQKSAEKIGKIINKIQETSDELNTKIDQISTVIEYVDIALDIPNINEFASKVASISNKLNDGIGKVAKAFNIIQTSISYIDKLTGINSDWEKATVGIQIMSDLGSVAYNRIPGMGWYGDYLSKATSAALENLNSIREILKENDFKTRKHAMFANKPYMYQFSPGGIPVFKFMQSVMRAKSFSELDTSLVNDNVANFFEDKNESKINKSLGNDSNNQMPVDHSWLFDDTLKKDEFLVWVFKNRYQIWYMLYGSVNIKDAIQMSTQKSNTSNDKAVGISTIPKHVNIHENSSRATDLGALAFTQGSDIHFAPGQFKPDTKSGQELIGHELKHVEQQAEGRVSPTIQKKGSAINDDPTLEKEADDFGKVYAADLAKQSVPVQRKTQYADSLKADPEGRSGHQDTNDKGPYSPAIQDNVTQDITTDQPPFQLKLTENENQAVQPVGISFDEAHGTDHIYSPASDNAPDQAFIAK